MAAISFAPKSIDTAGLGRDQEDLPSKNAVDDRVVRWKCEYIIIYNFREDLTAVLRSLKTAGFDAEISDDPTKMKVWIRGDSNF